jgi:hypothetical protein
MAERFSEIEKPLVSKQPSLEERLKEYPGLQTKIETMLAIIENSGGDVEKAAEAERRIIEELRQMGNEVLHGWARRQQQKKEEEYDAQPGVNRKEKKSSTGTRDWGKSK